MAVALAMLRCARCGRIDTRMRTVCAGCLAADLQPCDVAAEGRIVSFTTIRRAPSRFRGEAPYDVVVVDLDAGHRVTGRLAAASAPPRIGAPVRAETSDLRFTVVEES